MLSQEENELITRVGPGTPMGNLFREYWLPAMLSEELPTSDSDPASSAKPSSTIPSSMRR